MNRLKNCPFCGHEAFIAHKDHEKYYIYCPGCKIKTILTKDLKKLKDSWNKRTQEENEKK